MNEDRATRYHRLKRTLTVGAAVGRAMLLVVVGVAGRDWLDAVVSSAVPDAWPALQAAAAVLVLLVVSEILFFPLNAYSGFLLERRFGLSQETFVTWVDGYVKALALGAGLGGPAVGVLYLLIGWFPETWWAPASIGFVGLAVAVANLAPVVLLPMFYAVRPLARESLRRRLVVLADRMGADVVGAYEWGLGSRSTRANAALTGLGATRRILVSDTMLAEYSDDEIEVVLAHEIAHHVRGDIWRSIALESGLALVGFYCAARALRWYAGVVGLDGPGDPAGLPALLLTIGGVSVVLAPVVHAASRQHERHADRLALDATGNPTAFVSALRRLGAQNLAEEHPSKLTEWLFSSHPPLEERMAFARTYLSRIPSGERRAGPGA